MEFNEMFPPNEEELDQMILNIQEQMKEAESKLEYDHLHDQLRELREKRQQLIIENNDL